MSTSLTTAVFCQRLLVFLFVGFCLQTAEWRALRVDKYLVVSQCVQVTEAKTYGPIMEASGCQNEFMSSDTRMKWGNSKNVSQGRSAGFSQLDIYLADRHAFWRAWHTFRDNTGLQIQIQILYSPSFTTRKVSRKR